MGRKRADVKNREELEIWARWVRGFSIAEIASMRGIPQEKVLNIIINQIKSSKIEDAQGLSELEINARKVIAELDIIIQRLWLAFTQEEARYRDATNIDEAHNSLNKMLSLLSQIQRTVVAKAEILRKFGLAPSAVERTATLVGVTQMSPHLQQPVTIDPLNLLPRVPTRLSLTDQTETEDAKINED